LRRARELLGAERFAEALDLLADLGPDRSELPEVLLLRAALLLQRGDLDQAEQAARRLLADDEHGAGGHYLVALCREEAGDAAGALEGYRRAALLDPGFALARLHLGLLARRRHDTATARRELANAVELLQREDPARLQLFGGGFGRAALVALARAELLACGRST
jgi:chemotaxis protein methyltransferase CheR